MRKTFTRDFQIRLSLTMLSSQKSTFNYFYYINSKLRNYINLIIL